MRVLKVYDSDRFDEDYFIVSDSNIEEIPLADTCDDYGQPCDIGNYIPGDSDFDRDLVDDLRYEFSDNDAYSNIDWNADFLDYNSDLGGEDDYDGKPVPYTLWDENYDEVEIPSEIESFIRQFIKDYSNVEYCTSLEYWDGHNNRSIVLSRDSGEDTGSGLELLDEDDEEAEEVIADFENAEQDEPHMGCINAHGKIYNFQQTAFDRDAWYIWAVERK